MSENVSKPVLPRKEPVQERSRARFSRILEVAQDLVAKRGVDAVPMSDIAKEAGISVASLYQYFPDKTAIIATLAQRINARGQACIQAVFRDVDDVGGMIGALNRMTDEYYGYFNREPFVLTIWQATQSDPRLQAVTAADEEAHAQTIEQALGQVLPALPRSRIHSHSKLLTGIIAGVVRHAITLDPSEGARMIDDFKTYFLTPSVQRILQVN